MPFYNADKFIEQSIMSALTQKHNNFTLVVINDASSDNSDKIVQDLLMQNQEKIIYINNKERMGAMYNHQNAIFNYCNTEDIVIHLDGDDWFPNNKVLSYIDDFYNFHGCLMMYGQAKYFSGREGNARPYLSKEEFDNKRNLPFFVSHIRTFRAKAFFEIKNQDPDLECFKDDKNNWYSMAPDVAMMYPLLEICGYDKVKYNDKVLYIYNDSNPICEFKVNLQLQEQLHRHVLAKKPFKQIDL